MLYERSKHAFVYVERKRRSTQWKHGKCGKYLTQTGRCTNVQLINGIYIKSVHSQEKQNKKKMKFCTFSYAIQERFYWIQKWKLTTGIWIECFCVVLLKWPWFFEHTDLLCHCSTFSPPTLRVCSTQFGRENAKNQMILTNIYFDAQHVNISFSQS